MLRIAMHSCVKAVCAQLMLNRGQVYDKLTKNIIKDFLGFLSGAAPKVGQTGDRHCDFLSNLYEVQNREKALFDAIEYDSEVERQFAQDLDTNENVRLFVKLRCP